MLRLWQWKISTSFYDSHETSMNIFSCFHFWMPIEINRNNRIKYMKRAIDDKQQVQINKSTIFFETSWTNLTIHNKTYQHKRMTDKMRRKKSGTHYLAMRMNSRLFFYVVCAKTLYVPACQSSFYHWGTRDKKQKYRKQMNERERERKSKIGDRKRKPSVSVRFINFFVRCSSLRRMNARHVISFSK